MLYTIASAALAGIDAYPVQVEVDVSLGLPNWITVGLPDPSVKESKERVRAALKNCGYDCPPRRIVINLAPADRRKEGPAFDLPIALGLLAELDAFPSERLGDYLILGELALDGSLKPVKGVLAAAVLAERLRFDGLVLPRQNMREACLVRGIKSYALDNIIQVVRLLNEPDAVPPSRMTLRQLLPQPKYDVDFRETAGQHHVKRALEVAAAGGHNVLMIGPPGAGKTMLARRIPTILPPMALKEILTVTRIYSAAGRLPDRGVVGERPFRAPHHTITQAGLIGGGLHPRPGEVSLAHHGVLFLDEFSEFKRPALDSLRQPLEDGAVTISRTFSSETFPAAFMLVAAMNPWEDAAGIDPDGFESSAVRRKQRYYSRLSGPLLDRIDIQIEVPKIEYREIRSSCGRENSVSMRKRVVRAREAQHRRFSGTGISNNARMGSRAVDRFCSVGDAGAELLERAVTVFGFSARAYVRALKVARTIADLEGQEDISAAHVAEAVQYRMLDKYFK